MKPITEPAPQPNMFSIFNGTDLEYRYLDNEDKLISTSINNKELLVLTLYVNCDNISNAKAREYISIHNTNLRAITKRIEENTNYYVEIFIIAVQNQPTKLECTFSSKNNEVNNDLLNNIESQLKL